MDVVELRRKRIINILYLLIILGLAYLFIKYCFWMFAPFLFAFFIALIVQKPANFLVRKSKIKNGLISTILTVLIYLIILAIIAIIGVKCVDGVRGLIDFLKERISDFPTLIDNVKQWVIDNASILPNSLEDKFVASTNNWFDFIRDKSAAEIASLIVDSAGDSKITFSTFSTPLSGILSTAKQIPSVFIAILIAVISSCFMAADYDTFVNFIKRQMKPENKEKLSKCKSVVFKSIGKLLRSYALIILITGLELFIGLNILSFAKLYTGGQILVISFLVALLDILPVIGTGTFMVPWIIYSFITGKVGFAIGLLIIYAIIAVVRQIIEPKLVAGSVGLPSFVTLMAMYVGTQMFGVVGLFLLPILVIIIKLLNDEGIIHIWKTEEKEEEKETENVNSAETTTENA